MNGLGKRFRLGTSSRNDTLIGSVVAILRYPIDNFRRLTARKTFTEGDDDETVLWALRDLDFKVHRGDVLGIIGHNGAGKSSLLKILSRITPPSVGTVHIGGRVSSLLEVGTGFHPDLTGRDNVYMNGTILGMSKKEIDAKFDEIVAFSGISRHIDTPIKFYSSGMKVRLAFSVAAHLDPEILIIDEVLAVGDLAFQQKCLGKMDEVAKGGRTVLFVSHDMVAVEGLCTRCILMEDGRIAYDGSVSGAIAQYRKKNMAVSSVVALADRTDREGGHHLRFTGVRFNEGRPVLTHEPLTVDVTFHATEPVDAVQIAVKFSRSYREVIMCLDSRHNGYLLSASPGSNTVRIELPMLHLIPGEYLIDLWAGSGVVCEDRIFNADKLTVIGQDVYGTGFVPLAGQHGFIVPAKSHWQPLPVPATT